MADAQEQTSLLPEFGTEQYFARRPQRIVVELDARCSQFAPEDISVIGQDDHTGHSEAPFTD